MADSPSYNRRSLVDVIAEYERQAALPSIVLTADNMRQHAEDELQVKHFMADVDSYFETSTE